ncbi:hypothetical protein ANCCAN_04400 [Ancylostoma caninum]|uniref:Uncharacterized protein n=1 Tax=Ancylostoma caninum TaxID=29170 RepID=A0A368H1G9_ANCCA|nr:hypothetical protein ANCCAN_04400 [Ancylostoma caninum]
MNSYPIRSSGGGSLRMKLAERNRSTQLLPKESFQSNSICIMEDNKKSASLQALATSNLNGSNPDTTNSFQEKVMQKNGSGSNSIKGSRSSGLQVVPPFFVPPREGGRPDEAGANEILCVSAVAPRRLRPVLRRRPGHRDFPPSQRRVAHQTNYRKNAVPTSIFRNSYREDPKHRRSINYYISLARFLKHTCVEQLLMLFVQLPASRKKRFDTDNKDFDQRLAMVIGQGEGGFEKGFWEHHDSLNRWTLKFNEKIVEDEYRAHFADSADRHVPHKTPVGLHQDFSRRDQIDHTTQYRYSGVFIDILVAAILLVVVSAAVFMSPSAIPLSFVVYFCLALTTVIAAIGLIGVPLLSRKSILPCVNLWQPRHIIGAVLIALPFGVAVCVMPLCILDACPTVPLMPIRLLFSYIMIVALFAHCNFSQLGAWPKTIQCIIVGLIHISAVYYCQTNIDRVDPQVLTSN